MLFTFLKKSPHISLRYVPVPAQYREYQNGLFKTKSDKKSSNMTKTLY